ncbi:hypothetical protein GCM10023320_65110 [Pseudonocardia adelaidensis]|uniref:Uncharacterized protein n=1 Tax=Pseudonocardia adelaidensis TaxID=648754 RepID=A0ABP9NWC8_9PSEU
MSGTDAVRGGTLVSCAGAAGRPELLDMTSVSDGHTHAITAGEFEQGVLTGLGRYRAVCGADVMVASMVARPGPRCPRCAEHRRQSECAVAPPPLVTRLARRARGLLPGRRS